MNDLRLTPQLAAIFEHLIEDSSGLYYGPADRDLLGAKLAAQAEEAGFESLLDYYYRLRYDDPTGRETRALVQSLLVHETYFFRELAPLERIVAGPVRDAIAVRGRARVWSAACSTGEEPITLAMLLDEAGLLDRVDLVATDLSEAAIARARAGRHSRRALRDGHPPHLAARYLTVGEREVASAAHLRDAIDFRVANLRDDDAIGALGHFDAILCRNVLIYFRDTVVAQVLGRLTRALQPGGVLAVGVSESLLRYGTSLVCEERGGVFLYRSAPP